jgi:DNA polymerase III sliding clamp (beta) subunit (PCNA family)
MKAIIEVRELKSLIRATRKFISQDENRVVLQYIRLDFLKGNKVKAVALNGFMLSVENGTVIKCDENFSVYIKPSLPLGATNNKVAEVELNGDICYINIDGNIVGFKQPDCKPFNEKDILEKHEKIETVFKIGVDKDKFSEVLKSIEKRYVNDAVTIEFKGENQPFILRTGTGIKYLMPMRI